MLGSAAMIAGRSIPGSILRTKRDTAISAPVLPALTQACASPFLTSSTATRTDSCFAQWEGRSRLGPVMRPGEPLLASGLDDLLAAIVTARADVMPQMHFARCRLDRERRVAEEIVSPVHAALRWGFLVLL